MFAVGVHLFTALLLVLGIAGRYTLGVLLLGGIGLARGGAALLRARHPGEQFDISWGLVHLHPYFNCLRCEQQQN